MRCAPAPRRCRVHSVHRGRCVKRTLRPGIVIFPCSSVDSVAIIIWSLKSPFTFHVSRFTHWCTECTLRSFRVFPYVSVAIIFCRAHFEHAFRCVKNVLRLYFHVSVFPWIPWPLSIAPVIHVSPFTSHALVHRVRPTFVPCISVCFRGHYSSRMRCAPTKKRPAFVFPCSSVDSVAIIHRARNSRFTFHVSRIGARSAPYIITVCFRGHYPSHSQFTSHVSPLRTP